MTRFVAAHFRLIRYVVCAGAVVLMTCVAGCQTAQPTTAEPVPPRVAFDVKNLQPVEAVKAVNLLPLRAGATVYQMTHPAPTAENLAGQLRSTTHGATTARGDGDEWLHTVSGLGVTHYQMGADGTIHIVGDDDENERVQVRYEPPLVALPGELTMDKPANGQSTMIVRNLDGSERDRGKCDYRIELLGKQTIDTPAGRFDVTIVRVTRDIDLALAKVHVTIDTAYAPGVGMVAERVDQRIRALGLFPISKSYQLLRLKR